MVYTRARLCTDSDEASRLPAILVQVPYRLVRQLACKSYLVQQPDHYPHISGTYPDHFEGYLAVAGIRDHWHTGSDEAYSFPAISAQAPHRLAQRLAYGNSPRLAAKAHSY